METAVNGTDRLRAILVIAATLGIITFNWLAAAGRINGITTGEISDQYPTVITPADYAFSIWSLIYFGLIAFSIYQLLPANLARFRSIRSIYIMSCALNCAWIYFWHQNQIGICLLVITGLLVTLLLININLRNPVSTIDSWISKATFGIYFGWVTAAMLVNFAVWLVYLDSPAGSSIGLGVGLILFATALAIIVRVRLTNYFYPLAVAWALTAIAVKQSGQTLLVVAAAVGVIACLIASLSFVMSLNSSEPA